MFWEQIKPLKPAGQEAEFKFDSKFKPLQVICLTITPEGYSKRKSKVLTEKSMALGAALQACTAWASQKGKHKHRVFLSRWQLLLVATGLVGEIVLPLLLT